MIAEELRAIIDYLREKVDVVPKGPKHSDVITFDIPTESEMINAGLNKQGVKQILSASWWDEMVTDIIETPEMCDDDDPPEQTLEYARDVVSDYIRKRFPLNGK